MKTFRVYDRAIYFGRNTKEILFNIGFKIDKNEGPLKLEHTTFYFYLGFWFLTITREY